MDYKELYRQIKTLILNPKIRKKIQHDGFKNVKHTIIENSHKIDRIREEITQQFSLNFLKNKLRILNIYNAGQKLNHRLYNISLGKKFTNGFIRGGHDVLEVSDRDYIKNNKLKFLNANNQSFEKFLLETYKNYNPDFIFFGHTKNISLDLLENFR